MTKPGNHRVEVQESEEYLAGREAARRGDTKPDWHTYGSIVLATCLLRMRLGWQDYHDQEKAK
jgi:hypothetical protein